MDNKLITVFTPTYNRIKLLPACYESLKRQNCRDFLWLIVDDGSKDGTEELVRRWMEDADFEIRYVRKENGGLHTAYNAAIEAMNTELAICMDSDDYLTDDSVAQIAEKWCRDGSDRVAGIVALNSTPCREVLGNPLPELPYAHLIDLYCRHHCRSDLKMVYRTDLLKKEGPIPVFDSEKHMNPYYLFLKIDKKYPMLLLNHALCVVNYQPDGMSTDIVRQYQQSPRSFAALRLMMVSMERATYPYIVKNTVHLASSALLAGTPSLLFQSPHKWIALLMFLPGLLLAISIKMICRIKYNEQIKW